jgi:hypothetical protein
MRFRRKLAAALIHSLWLTPGCVALGVTLVVGTVATVCADSPRPDALIGYTELSTNLPGGRHANVVTMRGVVVRADGTDRRVLAQELTREPSTWTQFAGWSPDGRFAILGRGWESPENGRWEEEHKQFRFSADDCLHDSFLVEMNSGRTENVTGVDRVSFYNSGLFFWPGDPSKLGFQAHVAALAEAGRTGGLKSPLLLAPGADERRKAGNAAGRELLIAIGDRATDRGRGFAFFV